MVFGDYGDLSCGTFLVGASSFIVRHFSYTGVMSFDQEKEIDYNDIRMWRNNPELILRTAKRFAYRWGQAYEDKEDLQMFIVEAILKVIEKFESGHGTTLYGMIWIQSKRAVLDYGRKYGKHFRGRNPETRVHFNESEYHEQDLDDMWEDAGSARLNEARFKGAHWDNHENFDLIQRLKKEDDVTRKIVFCFYFLEWTAKEIADELGCSENWINQKLAKFRERYTHGSRRDKWKSLFSCLEDLPMQKLDEFYELVLNQSNLTSE